MDELENAILRRRLNHAGGLADMGIAKESALAENLTSQLDRSLRIGFFSDFYLPVISGIAVSLHLLMQGLRNKGHSVTLFAPRFPGHRESEGTIWRVPSLRVMKRPRVYMAVPWTPRTTLALRRSRFDVLHVHSPLTVGMMGYITARAKHVPLIYTYHTSLTDYTHYLKVGGGTPPAREAARWFSTKTANLCDRVVVPSSKFKRLLEDQGVQRPIHVISNGIDLTKFYEPGPRGEYRARLGLGPDTPFLVYMGRLDPEKGLDRLIGAFGHVLRRHPDAHLVLAGVGSSRPALEAQAQASGHGDQIHFLGMLAREALPALLRDADMFVTPSTSEVQPLSMIEAIASGLAVVAAQDEAYREMVIDGFNGRYAQREPAPFGAAICELLDGPARLREYGRNSIEVSKRFSVESQAQALIELYEETIKR